MQVVPRDTRQHTNEYIKSGTMYIQHTEDKCIFLLHFFKDRRNACLGK